MSTSQPSIRVACVGAGYFSQFHFQAWERIEQTKIVAIAEQNQLAAEGQPYPVYTDLEEMIIKTAPDILDIITPPETHLDFLRIACRLGVKTIICQKAFCRNIDEAREAQKLSQQTGATIIVHENFRFQPWYRIMKCAIDDGLIGKVHQLTFRMRTGDGQGPNAYLARQPYFQEMNRFLMHETGVHWIDTFCFLLGKPTHLYCDLRRMNPHIAGEDAGLLVLDFEGNCRAVFDANRCIDHATEDPRLTFGECWLEGENGTLTLNGNGEVWHRQHMTCSSSLLLERQVWAGFAGDCVHALQNHVVRHLIHGSLLENTVADYIPVIELEAAAYRSAEIGCKIEV